MPNHVPSDQVRRLLTQATVQVAAQEETAVKWWYAEVALQLNAPYRSRLKLEYRTIVQLERRRNRR